MSGVIDIANAQTVNAGLADLTATEPNIAARLPLCRSQRRSVAGNRAGCRPAEQSLR